jgi:hypothetical protein
MWRFAPIVLPPSRADVAVGRPCLKNRQRFAEYCRIELGVKRRLFSTHGGSVQKAERLLMPILNHDPLAAVTTAE